MVVLRLRYRSHFSVEYPIRTQNEDTTLNLNYDFINYSITKLPNYQIPIAQLPNVLTSSPALPLLHSPERQTSQNFWRSVQPGRQPPCRRPRYPSRHRVRAGIPGERRARSWAR